ncbi:gastrin/cholecystokinin type B receptor-like protein [Dinothrombium tinctorium]|uniref:Gastrin/cholecystokinin type B receptor-like protein n=1 Tax=Dinothrombium tinctorium TaxID=1965070 RepID=A0A443R3Q1_9ACAR|nr:gastrin/cholecystokinin type B receptor-like protein [Dinothrombium tinctorium]
MVVPYSLIFFTAVVGNGLVVIVIIMNRRMRTKTNAFLLNLSISNFLLGVFCMPFTLIGLLMKEFIFGPLLCRLIPYLQVALVLGEPVQYRKNDFNNFIETKQMKKYETKILPMLYQHRRVKHHRVRREAGRKCQISNPLPIDKNTKILDDLTINEVSEAVMKNKNTDKVDNALRKRIAQLDFVNDTLEKPIAELNFKPGLNVENANIPLRYFPMRFWKRMAKHTKTSEDEIAKSLDVDLKTMYSGNGENAKPKPEFANKPVNVHQMLEICRKYKFTTNQVLDLFGFEASSYMKKMHDKLLSSLKASITAIGSTYYYLRGAYEKQRRKFRDSQLDVTSEIPETSKITEKIESPKTTEIVTELTTQLTQLPTKITTTMLPDSDEESDVSPAERRILCVFGYKFPTFITKFTKSLMKAIAFGSTAEKCKGKNCSSSSFKDFIFKMLRLEFDFFTNLISKNKTAGIESNKANKTVPKGDFWTTFEKYIGAHNTFFLRTFIGSAAVTFGSIFKPFLKIPWIIFMAPGPMRDRFFALPAAVIEITGNFLKPLFIVLDPLLRAFRFLITGEFDRSLTVGDEYKEIYDKEFLFDSSPKGKKSTLDGFDAEKCFKAEDTGNFEQNAKILFKDEEVYGTNESASNDKNKKPKEGNEPEKSQEEKERERATLVESNFVADYDGRIPKGGYKSNFSRPKTGVVRIFVKRFLYLPSFLFAAGGPLFGTIAEMILTPIDIMTMLAFDQGTFYEKLKRVPEKTKDSNVIYSTIGSLIESTIPLSDLFYDVINGSIGYGEMTYRAPKALGMFAFGPIITLFRGGEKLTFVFINFVTGAGGLVSTFFKQFSPDYNAFGGGFIFELFDECKRKSRNARKYFGDNEDDNWSFSIFFCVLNYMKPYNNFMQTYTNGFVGNVVDPKKMMRNNLMNFNDPLNSFVKLSENLAAMYCVATDRRLFLQAILGGQDIDEMKAVGLDADKMVRNGIDPVAFTLGGLKLLPKKVRSKMGNSNSPNVEYLKKVGVDESKLKLIGLDYKKLLTNGIFSAKEEAVFDYGISPCDLINRLLRNSLVSRKAFLNSGINIRKMIHYHVRPDLFLAHGTNMIKPLTFYQLGIDPNDIEAMKDRKKLKKFGVDVERLEKNGIDVAKFLKEGLYAFDNKTVRRKFGIDRDKLIFAVDHALDRAKLKSVGINLAKLESHGLSPSVLITGHTKLVIASHEQLRYVGLNPDLMSNSGYKPKRAFSRGTPMTELDTLRRLGFNVNNFILMSLSKYGLDLLCSGTTDDKGSTYHMSKALSRKFESTVGYKSGNVAQSKSCADNETKQDVKEDTKQVASQTSYWPITFNPNNPFYTLKELFLKWVGKDAGQSLISFAGHSILRLIVFQVKLIIWLTLKMITLLGWFLNWDPGFGNWPF